MSEKPKPTDTYSDGADNPIEKRALGRP